MSDEYLKYLENDERRMDVALRLFDYARGLLECNHGWVPGEMLPGAVDPENIVLEVFSRIALGKRKLNDRFAYEVQLKGMVRSIISKLYQKADARLDTIDLEEEDVGYSKVEKALGVGGPDSLFESQEYSERFFQLLEEHPKVKSDSDFGLVILAYIGGSSGSKEVATETGIPIARVYEYNRNLKPILREIQEKMK